LSTDYDIVVAGGGIAGLSAALTAARLGRATLVLTGDVLGGHLLNIDRIDGYPGFPEGIPGFDLCPIAQEQAADAGAEIVMAGMTALSADGQRWRIETATGTYTAAAVIVATGTRLREIGVPGESLLRGKGVSQCASCDAPLLRGRPVVVAGGGDSALQEALTLAEHCSSVTIIHHESKLSAQAAYRIQVEEQPKITMIPDSEITEILGQDAVDGVRIRSADGETRELECAAVFVFVGLDPNTAMVEGLTALDADRRIVTDAFLRTGARGLFAAGTVRAASAGRAAAAAGEGATAALAADRFLADGEWPAG